MSIIIDIIVNNSYFSFMRKDIIKWLLPNYFKRVGLLIALTALGLLINYLLSSSISENSDYNVFTRMLMAIGLLLIAISKQKVEDERIQIIRLQSFYVSLVGCFIYCIIMETYSLVSVIVHASVTLLIVFQLLVYIVLFNYKLNKSK